MEEIQQDEQNLEQEQANPNPENSDKVDLHPDEPYFLGYGRRETNPADIQEDDQSLSEEELTDDSKEEEYSESSGLYQDREHQAPKFQDENILNPYVPAEKRGKLYIVSTPIGNPDDITRRAIKVLGVCDLVVCEERKEGAALLHRLGLSKELDQLNEQNEIEKAPEILSLIQEGKKIGLISDGGTPLLADPGNELLRIALASKVDIEVVPGATSIMPALIRSGFSLDSFVFAGFLPRDRKEREKKIKTLSEEKRTTVLLETPYRLRPVLDAFARIMPQRRAYLGMNLTMHFESHHYGTFSQIWDKFKESKAKGAFVIVFEGDSAGAKSGVGERIERAYKQRSGNLADEYRHLEGQEKKRITIKKKDGAEREFEAKEDTDDKKRESRREFGGKRDFRGGRGGDFKKRSDRQGGRGNKKGGYGNDRRRGNR